MKEAKENGAIVKLAVNIGEATNNQAEYMSMIYALAFANLMEIKNLNIFMDSELVVKHLNREYRVKSDRLRPYYKTVLTKGNN